MKKQRRERLEQEEEEKEEEEKEEEEEERWKGEGGKEFAVLLLHVFFSYFVENARQQHVQYRQTREASEQRFPTFLGCHQLYRIPREYCEPFFFFAQLSSRASGDPSLYQVRN